MPGLLRLTPLVAAIVLSGCAARQPTVREKDGVSYGITQGPFRERWWHFYERGVSWELGGFHQEAERDFRACIAKRQTDSRRARTYGMHFVQCFAHRELGAVLIEQGRLDEAERFIQTSRAQEPSAKADFLLERIAALRTGKKSVPVPVAPSATSLVVDKVEEAGGQRRVEGRVSEGAEVWAAGAGGAKRPVTVEAGGKFSADLAADEHLIASAEDAPPIETTPKAAPADAPTLTLDGPEDGRVLSDPRVLYRYDAAASGALASLRVLGKDDRELANVPLSGVAAAGMTCLMLPSGSNRLRFVVTAKSGVQTTVERTLVVSPKPSQDPRLRAVTLIAPLKSPVDGQGLHGDDDEAFTAALNQDGRFRVIERRAELDTELKMVEAGWVDRATAAKLGRRLKARYVVVGTLRRGRQDIECFVRLIHADSGHVVANADAYAADLGGETDDAFFALVANRLRQVFPVLETQLRPSGAGERAVADIGKRHGVVVHMRFQIVPQQAQPAAVGEEPQVASTLEVEEVDGDSSMLRVVKGALVEHQSPGVSE